MLEIQVARWTNLLRRLMSIKGEAPLYVEQGLVPTIDVQPADWQHHFLRREKLWGAVADIPAQVAQSPIIRLRNPVGSGHIITGFWLNAYDKGGAQVEWGAVIGAGVVDFTAITERPLDSRIGFTQPSVGVASFTTGAVPAAGWGRRGANVTGEFPFVLHPGNYVDIWSVAQNIDAIINPLWYEYPAEPRELIT